ncbi:CusA/CzcA family heavy metal efflux RND transporter [Echinicola strongylocentroti]|uniref:CusA/CzcA family heavy metal efflux RND transporter n=1 Tax=Echinicola strongylocentroti TaxID=1795355 RepID=A0A2Z4IKC4_9BACT|nr:CusA/CzcA family heavy metal efflux RND transporter [Echinicola strongylocentroti]AWW30988.1 CusA/CzcA family heavy metal efflux RND transporter [Echinicola strongylocentroti]
MLQKLIHYSLHHKLVILLFTLGILGFGLYSLTHIPLGAVPDITNNQVQVITTSKNLATEDVEKFLTYPVELEMANLPNVKEIRSVSKFGLSIVTVVFEDRAGTYLPRQLIAEKLKLAEEKIPEGFGRPFMGPISTGLGEIYQYVIDVAPEYKGEYSITDLRTIQDWIIKRQLSGIPGVVEINTWGGYLKQYEVAVDPVKLRAMNIPLEKLYTVLRDNNSIAGGGYIEKTTETYFVRGEGLVESLEDIGNIVIENRNGVPVYVSDVAEVRFGHATRFGAITGNGEGEKVLGQVMMLKGADSQAVIGAVAHRVEEIKSSLPPGIIINPFLERSELIGKTTFTIAENLVLGCLIVIFVVVLLLGNLRSGLVVASVIPLCLLFALSLMYLTGVDANLMSLGAIDFGIIIDGAVIIVEFIAYQITSQHLSLTGLKGKERQSAIDKITLNGASKMMHSAVFGQLIIIIVFIPILSLVNVEGKMFRPMALVFCYALIGAMVLCFTYVPVMAALFIRPSNKSGPNLSAKLIAAVYRFYRPAIRWSLRYKKIVLSLAAGLLLLAGGLFFRMGGEFVPTLDEGDFVIQPVLKTGTSLQKTIETTTQMEKILLGFPEVDQVVTRIGAAEVPTDPMSMEESDVIIKLHPKDEWETAETKDGLADAFKEKLAILPGIDLEFTQPIEMRFNELITGVRADLAIKIFGEDLDLLYEKALEVEAAIQQVEGASDIIVEKTAGLPQMTVDYDRRKIAKYGLNVSDLNDLISMGFAGLPAGTVFEGEKQFDLVLRFDPHHRMNIQDIQSTSVQLPNGNSLPLSEFASIGYTTGPAKISRDDTKRRIVVGVNVRNRDLESVVDDVRKIIQEKISLPSGYSVTYGGQFENLRTARERLTIAVPIALLLIFIMLYFAFGSVKEAAIIYSAIPMAAVGGVFLLYVRGLPFSISAGVGFIALFGIAVLNGIVLIEEFKELREQGIRNVQKAVLIGTQKRLRPVLLTASAAALGFLPMAISHSAGAEVQRPLATVVVGGLVTATLLTLLVVPVLYALMADRKLAPKSPSKVVGAIILVLLSMAGNYAYGQDQQVGLKRATELALENNRKIRASQVESIRQEQLQGSAWNIGKTGLYYLYDENNIAENGAPIRVWGINQVIEFPTVYGARHRWQKEKANLQQKQHQMEVFRVKKEVAKAYYTVVYQRQLTDHYAYLDSLYKQFSTAAEMRFEAGESNLLEKLTAESKSQEMAVLLEQVQKDRKKATIALNGWIQGENTYQVIDHKMHKLTLENDTSLHPGLAYYNQLEVTYGQETKLEKQQLLPDLQVSLFQGTNHLANAKHYQGIQAGLAVPLWFGAQRSKIQAARSSQKSALLQRENYRIRLKTNRLALLEELKKYRKAIDYYEHTGKKLATGILSNAQMAYREGEIDFLQYIQLLENARNIEITYLKNLWEFNMTILEANFITK